jgi:hypothetical protein
MLNETPEPGLFQVHHKVSSKPSLVHAYEPEEEEDMQAEMQNTFCFNTTDSLGNSSEANAVTNAPMTKDRHSVSPGTGHMVAEFLPF